MFEHFTTLDEIVRARLGRAWSMENDVAALLGLCARFAQDLDVGDMCRAHAEQCRTRADRIEAALADLGGKMRTGDCPATKGLADEGKSGIRRCDDRVVDAVILATALECAHYEIAVYAALAAQAAATSAKSAGELARQHRDQAEQLRDAVMTSLPRICANLDEE
jgi:ferritin-like metal-binding protein YciE